MCRVGGNERDLFNGHKRVHSTKCQSVALPSELAGHSYGPVDDSNMLASSGLLQGLQRFSNSHVIGISTCL